MPESDHRAVFGFQVMHRGCCNVGVPQHLLRSVDAETRGHLATVFLAQGVQWFLTVDSMRTQPRNQFFEDRRATIMLVRFPEDRNDTALDHVRTTSLVMIRAEQRHHLWRNPHRTNALIAFGSENSRRLYRDRAL